jgi:glycosyltransferase involved in cell wall biosynthesis
MTTLSVCIITRNEEHNIKDCLETIKWADEIVIIDSESTDQTVAIAQQYTTNIPPYQPQQPTIYLPSYANP